MKILSLNTWGGRAGKEKLLNFIASQADDVDVFCFQEIWSAPYDHHEGALAGGLEIRHENIMVYGVQEISGVLTNFEYFFHPHYLDNYGLMMLVKKDIEVVGSGDIFVHKKRGHVPEGDIGKHARNIQYVTLVKEGAQKTVINFHGLWTGTGKGDTEDRLEQSRNIVEFIQTLKGEMVLCGDFNLLPDTESIKVLEKSGLQNLIRTYGVTSTRTSLYSKPIKFADYVFVNSKVDIKNFSVLQDEVSDHSPMLIEIA